MQTASIDFDGGRTFLAEAQCVLFTARRGERTLRCYITRGALAACFGVRADRGEPASAHALRCFDAHAPRIQAAARRLIERDGAPSGALIVDMAGALLGAELE